MGSGKVPSADHLGYGTDAGDLARIDPAAKGDLVAERIRATKYEARRLGCGHLSVRARVVADKNVLVVRDAKVNRREGALATSAQLAQPLVGGEEVRQQRHTPSSRSLMPEPRMLAAWTSSRSLMPEPRMLAAWTSGQVHETRQGSA
jgi:hypothetical protein